MALIVFRPDFGQIPKDKWTEVSQFTPRVGHGYKSDDRIPEYKQDPSRINLDHPNDSTHCRPGPWQILDDGQSYVADMPGLQDFNEVIVYRLGYSPIPETENPWEDLSIEYKGVANLSDEHLASMGLDVDQIQAIREREPADTKA